MEEEPGEGIRMLGEGAEAMPGKITSPFRIEEPIREKKLTFEEASKFLNTLGKDESGVRYAYLMVTATDRKLTEVSTLLNFKHVLFLDLSGNFLNLEALQVLTDMLFLLYLKVERNIIESGALDPMPYLQCLILNKNQITETCDINQPVLETLELQDNLIFTIQFDTERVKNLKVLNLRGNQLMDFSGTYPASIERLYMNQNKINKINMDFSQLPNLKILHLRDNQLRKLTGFTDKLANLTYLNLRNNQIGKMREIAKLQCLSKLDTIITTDNPITAIKGAQIQGEMDEEDEEEVMFGEDQFEVKDKTRVPLIVLLPNLKRINKDPVTFEEKEEAKMRRSKILNEIYDEASSEEETELSTTTDLTTGYTTETEGAYNTRDSTIDEDETAEGRDTPVTNGNDSEAIYPSTKEEQEPESQVTTAGETEEAVSAEEGQLKRIKEEDE